MPSDAVDVAARLAPIGLDNGLTGKPHLDGGHNQGATLKTTSARFLLAALTTGVVSAEVRADAVDQEPTIVVDLAKRVAAQSRIRVRLHSGTTFSLRNAAVDGARLIGQPDDTDSLVGYQVEELEHVWRRGSAASTGLLIGGGLGLIGGAIAGVALADWCLFGSCPPASGGDRLKAAAGGGLVGAAAIGLVGALIAAPMKRWRTVYQGGHRRPALILSTRQIGVRVPF